MLTVVLTFTAVAPGDITFSLSNCHLSSPDGTPLAEPAASATMTVKETASTDPEDSEQPAEDQSSLSDKDENGIPYHGVLTSITVSAGELIPEFSPLIYDYVVKVDHDVEIFEVDAERRSEDDYIWFEGSKKLSETGTVRTIRVYDDNGHDNTYKIVVQRAAAPEESSESEEAVSLEEESSAAQTAAVTTADVPDDTSEEEISSSKKSSDSSKSSSSAASGMSELRRKLMPWLIVILGVLLLALFIVIMWIRNKSERKRRRIKSSSGKK